MPLFHIHFLIRSLSYSSLNTLGTVCITSHLGGKLMHINIQKKTKKLRKYSLLPSLGANETIPSWARFFDEYFLS